MACCFTPSTCTHGQGPFSRKLIASLEILFGLVIFTPEKLVTVSWRKLCSPLDEGGLNLISISGTSGATILKLCWSFVYSGDQWVGVLRARFLRNHCQYGGYKKYSLLSSLKQHLPTIFPNKAWVLNYGSKINFWNNAWCMAAPIVESLGIPLRIRSLLSSSVMDFRTLNQWNIPQLLLPVQMF